MIYKILKNADKGIEARSNINENFEKLYNTGLICGNLLNQFVNEITTVASKINLIDNIVASSSDIFEFDYTNKTIKILKNGIYSFSGNLIFETDNANERIEFLLYKNGLETNIRGLVVSSGVGKKDTIGYTGYMFFKANDIINFYVKTEVGTTNITSYYSNIGLEKKVF